MCIPFFDGEISGETVASFRREIPRWCNSQRPNTNDPVYAGGYEEIAGAENQIAETVLLKQCRFVLE